MPSEGVYVQSLLIVDGSIPVRDTKHSAATHMQHLRGPRTHIAKALRHAFTLVAMYYCNGETRGMCPTKVVVCAVYIHNELCL